jgi:hypothetical protein
MSKTFTCAAGHVAKIEHKSPASDRHYEGEICRSHYSDWQSTRGKGFYKMLDDQTLDAINENLLKRANALAEIQAPRASLSGEERRCNTCHVKRPVEAFHPKNDARPGRKPTQQGHCVGCSNAANAIMKIKAEGGGIEQIEKASNEAFDRVRDANRWPKFDLAQHLAKKAAAEAGADAKPERLPPIVKMCKCCEEERPHARAGAARWREELVSTQVTCVDCCGAHMMSVSSFASLSVDERRAKRDESIVSKRSWQDREARGVLFCHGCKQEFPRDERFWYKRPGDKRKNGGRAPDQWLSQCRSCARSAAKFVSVKLPNGKHTIEAAVRHGHMTVDRAAELSRDYFSAIEAGIKPRRDGQLDIAQACVQAGVDPGRMRSATPAVPVPKPAPAPKPEPTIDELVARRQALHDAREQAAINQPKESRQVRRARERRIAKDAASATKVARKEIMSELRALAAALGRTSGTKSRSKGGVRVVKRTQKEIKAALTPTVTAQILKRQGYKCALTGRPFADSVGYGSSNPYAPSPNRVNPGGDYTEDNVEYVLWIVNRMIGDAPREQALELLRDFGMLSKNLGQLSML